MATGAARPEMSSLGAPKSAALQHRPWNSPRRLSRGLAGVERFLGEAGFDRAPWLTVAFGVGIAAWFILPTIAHWIALLAGCGAVSMLFATVFMRDGRYPYLRLAGIAIPVMVAAGCGSVWTRSYLVGAEPIARPLVATVVGRILAVEVQPAQKRSRLVLATREPESGRAIRVRLNVAEDVAEVRQLRRGTVLRVRARLVPPAPPMLPGSYSFARTAWFGGLAATGSALDPPQILSRVERRARASEMQRDLTQHVHQQLAPGQAGIAAALTTGDMGGISEADAQAMRDSGLAHLLSISGLHVSAVIGAVYFVAMRCWRYGRGWRCGCGCL